MIDLTVGLNGYRAVLTVGLTAREPATTFMRRPLSFVGWAERGMYGFRFQVLRPFLMGEFITPRVMERPR